MKEQLHAYGAERNLQGIATIPVELDKQRPAVILLNSGVIHKVGPFNLNINFARKLSSEGYLVFRFDLSGLGDSVKIKDGTPHHEVVVNDVKKTMSFIEDQYVVDKFIIIGLCTGADYAHKVAREDSRVVGNVWLDGYGYPTIKFKMLRYAPIFLNPMRLINSVFGRVLNKGQKHEELTGLDAYIWKLPDKEKYASDMEVLRKRKVKCLYIFSGGVNEYYNYKNQFFDSFKGHQFLNNIDVEYYPEFDHTYIILKDREYMIKRVSDWLNNSF